MLLIDLWWYINEFIVVDKSYKLKEERKMFKLLALINVILDLLGFIPGPIGLVSCFGRFGTSLLDDDDNYSMTVPTFIPRTLSATKNAAKLYHASTNFVQASKGALRSVGKMTKTGISIGAVTSKLFLQIDHAGNAFRGASNACLNLTLMLLFALIMFCNVFQLFLDVEDLFRAF